MTSNLCIVGGGFLGLNLALALNRLGHGVTLMEQSEELGGLARPADIGGYTWDRFYHVILLSDRHLLGLLRELGLEERIQWGITRTGFYTDGKFYSMSDILEFLRFPPLKLVDKLRLGATIFYASRIRSWQRLESVTAQDWLTRLSGRRTADKIWIPLLKSKLGNTCHKASASFIWAIIARMYAARNAGLKQEMFGVMDRGYQQIIQRFRALLAERGVVLETGQKVCRVAALDKGASAQGAFARGASVYLETGEERQFDAAVLTVPTPVAARLVPGLTPGEKARLNRVTYLGVICVSLLLKQKLKGYYVTNITDDWVPFTTVIEMTALADAQKFGGHTLVYLPVYLPQSDPLWDSEDQAIVQTFVDALLTMYPGLSRDDIVGHTVSRERYVLPLTVRNYSAQCLPPRTFTQERVFCVNSAQIANGTMNINEITGLAGQAAQDLAPVLEGKK